MNRKLPLRRGPLKMNNMQVLKMVTDLLTERFGDLISRVILFGSRVDGTAREYSDYDVLLIIKETVNWKRNDQIIDVITEFNVKNDLLIDLHILAESDMNTIKGKQPYVSQAMNCGLLL